MQMKKKKNVMTDKNDSGAKKNRYHYHMHVCVYTVITASSTHRRNPRMRKSTVGGRVLDYEAREWNPGRNQSEGRREKKRKNRGVVVDEEQT